MENAVKSACSTFGRLSSGPAGPRVVDWWRDHEEWIRRGPPDFLFWLKFRKLEAPPGDPGALGQPAHPINRDPRAARVDTLPVCGEPLMRFVPGEVVRGEDGRVRGQGWLEQCQQGYWLHPGVYCPNRCTWVMAEFRGISD